MPPEGVEFVHGCSKRTRALGAAVKRLSTISVQGLQMLSQGLALQISKMGMPIDSLDRVSLGQMVSFMEQKFDGESTSLYATARLWDDGIIDPRDTRVWFHRHCRFAKSFKQEASSTFGVARI